MRGATMLEIIRGFYLWSVLRTFLIVNCQRSLGGPRVCNLCRLPNVDTNSSDIYEYKKTDKQRYIPLYASLAVDQKYQNHSNGDCFGSKTGGPFPRAWWSISLPGQATIYKVNLLFREKNVRHHGYYVFISESKVDVNNLSSLTPVYHEKNPYPTEQSIIQFPDGIQGQQLYIYLNKSNPVKSDSEYKNNVLDICEVEIWGFLNHTICTGIETNFTEGIYNSHIPWNNVTLVCYQRSNQSNDSCNHLTGQRSSDKCDNSISKIPWVVTGENGEDLCQRRGLMSLNKTCVINFPRLLENITFICSDCPDAPFNSSTTDLDTSTAQRYYFIGDNITYKCNSNHSLVSGNLTRNCLGNGTWSGQQPVCRNCPDPTYNSSTTDLDTSTRKQYYFSGENITYKCNSNHSLVSGNLTRNCLDNGSWSGKQPVCRSCAEFSYNTNTTDSDTAIVQHYVVDKTITFTCKKNHRLVSGNLTRVCLENGIWSGKKPVCKICTCPCQRLASQNFITDPIVLKKRIEELKKILVVNRSKLSASIRKKTSIRDDRMSSKGIGMTLGVGVITCIILTIVCSDLLMFFKRRQQK
uniref:E-selectin-like n=1 Tax=Crassostrea virginica TaxID=6565 RepID=A0A8B8EF43_CRAVI|nr:E-selectin-like [Crassostrea virginica]